MSLTRGPTVARILFPLACLASLSGASPGTGNDMAIRDASLADVRQRVAALEQKEATSADGKSEDQATLSYEKYLADYYRQESEVREQRVAVYQWQIFASNVVLFLVSLLTIAGVIFSGFQLYTAATITSRHRAVGEQENEGDHAPPTVTSADSVDLEISAQRIRLQTSVIGIVVLVASGIFLSLFLRNVYDIKPVSDCIIQSAAMKK